MITFPLFLRLDPVFSLTPSYCDSNHCDSLTGRMWLREKRYLDLGPLILAMFRSSSFTLREQELLVLTIFSYSVWIT